MPRTLVLIGFSAVLVLAQNGSSTISGSVKDGTGAVLASAKVKIVNEQTGTSFDTETNDAGLYRVGALLPGIYRVEVETNGFERLVRRPVSLEVGQVVGLDLTLQLGQASETVTVTEAAPLMHTQSAELGDVVEHRRVVELPLNGRFFVNLVPLTVGVTPAAGVGNPNNNQYLGARAGQPGSNGRDRSIFQLPRSAASRIRAGSRSRRTSTSLSCACRAETASRSQYDG